MRIYILLLASLVSGVAMGQDFTLTEQFAGEDEAVTARSMGVAGAFGAVGADFSAATNNPAGMAFFRKKELGLGIGYQDRGIESTYLDALGKSESSILRLNNIGFNYSQLQTEWIGDSLAVKREGLVSWSLAIGMNQKVDYDEVTNYDGLNENSSLLTGYVQSANQFARNSFSDLDEFERQAFETDLLDATQSGNVFLYDSPLADGGLQQNGEISRIGARRDFFLSGGVNVDNKLYVGATFGIPWIHYEEGLSFSETDVNNTVADFQSLLVDQKRDYDGVGANLGVGAIYRFSDYFRAGLKVKTPTVVELTENTSIRTQSQFGTTAVAESDFTDEYLMTLPWNGGLQLVASHPQYGLISLEADYVDYKSTRIEYLNDEFGDFDPFEESFKDEVQDFYRGAFNFRGGLEARLLKNLRLRGGAAYNQSPYDREEDEFGADYGKLTLGLGAGLRVEPANLTFDLGLNRITTGEFNSAYLVNNTPNSIINDEETFLIRLNVSKRFNQ